MNLWGFTTSIRSQNIKTIEGGPFGNKLFIEKSLRCRKTERGTLLDFSTSILLQNIKEIEGGPFGDFFPEKRLTMAKRTERGDALVSPGIVCYAGEKKTKNLFGSIR